tara:strand:+ start:26033 stop:26884 length:852 start_codon:yes stop_codon:yes gene_type:complete
MKQSIKIAKTLIEALPYIKKFNSKTIVVKFGGSIGSKDFSSFSKDIVLMKLVGINPVVVHGGGPEISNELKSKKIKSNFINGMRITCNKTMKIVEKVLGGKVNKKIVKEISINGGMPIGLTGRDNNLIIAKKIKLSNKDQDLGRVGEITKINKNYINKLIKTNYIPIIAPIGYDQNGLSYNINADYAASKVASAINAERLIILTNVSGIKDKKNKLISSLRKKRVNYLIDQGVIEKGMVPKVKCLIDALTDGVKKTHIIDGTVKNAIILEMFTDSGIGTEILL